MFNGTNKGQTQYCQFQNECIEYKDISYLKIMPICAIHELSIACHDRINKCKYYKLYTQLQRLKAENGELKKENTILELITEPQREEIQKYRDKALQFKQALEDVGKIDEDQGEDRIPDHLGAIISYIRIGIETRDQIRCRKINNQYQNESKSRRDDQARFY